MFCTLIQQTYFLLFDRSGGVEGFKFHDNNCMIQIKDKNQRTLFIIN